MATAPQQTEPAEGPREDEPAADPAGGHGISSTEPAEGGDDVPAGGSGSPE